MYATWAAPAQWPPLPPKSPCRMWAVTTTIFPPTKTVRQLAELPGWCLVIAGDKKGPEEYNVSGNAIYLTPDDQVALPFKLPRLLRWNHFGRKNAAFLYAVAHGAHWVYDTDDDNELEVRGVRTTLVLPSEKKGEMVAEAQTTSPLLNLYPQMGGLKTSWPRGFPLDLIKSAPTRAAHIRDRAFPLRRVGVIQSLADNDPDVDAIYRLTQPLPFSFQMPGGAAGDGGGVGGAGVGVGVGVGAGGDVGLKEDLVGRRLASPKQLQRAQTARTDGGRGASVLGASGRSAG
eukprot:4782887-Pleurochrysis_carterae.AAC.1